MTSQRIWVGGIVLMSIAGCAKPALPTGSAPAAALPVASSADLNSLESSVASEAAAPAASVPAVSDAPSSAAALGRLAISSIFVIAAADAPDARLSVDEIRQFLEDPRVHESFVPDAPLGLGDVTRHIPADNPMTRAKAELGRMLYFDKRLSRDSSVACASCHDPGSGWAQNTAVAAGIGGQTGGRNSPTVMNRIFGTSQFWDGRAATLEDQALGPIQNPIEMGFTLDELLERLNGIEGYRIMFEHVFCDAQGPGKISAANIAKAIATFERTVLVGEAPYDYFNRAEKYTKLPKDELNDLLADPEQGRVIKQVLAEAEANPMSEAAIRGRDLFFGKARCTDCHAGANFADEQFYNVGVAPETDLGRAQVTKDSKHSGAFKTPTVRNIAANAPYMHDGSQKTLMEVVEHYDKGGTPGAHQHERIKKLNLTPQEKEDLVAFMTQGLTGKLPDIRAPKLP